MQTSGADVNEEQDVIGNEPERFPDLLGEEVSRAEDVLVRVDEVLPARPLLPFWCGLETGFFQDVRHGRTADPMADILQSALDSRVPPRAIGTPD